MVRPRADAGFAAPGGRAPAQTWPPGSPEGESAPPREQRPRGDTTRPPRAPARPPSAPKPPRRPRLAGQDGDKGPPPEAPSPHTRGSLQLHG